MYVEEHVRGLREILPELIAEKRDRSENSGGAGAPSCQGHTRRHGASTASTRTLHLRALNAGMHD